jgi:UDP-glucose 4-epimerase
MKILITGGAGFIGWNLYNKLKNNHIVTLIDNFSTSEISSEKRNVINLDISTYSQKLEELISDVDLVFHLAGSVGVKKIDSEYHSALMNSININNVVFPLCEKYQTKVIYASTSEVYGECENAKETDNLTIASPEFGRGSYSCAKLMSEFIIKSYTFPSTIVRFFNIVGKGQVSNYGMVIPNFIEKAKNNEDLTVHDDGTQVRSFCDIDDAVIMLELLMDSKHDDEIYNIGNPKNTINMCELAKKVINLTHSDSKIQYKDTKDIFSKEFFEIVYRTPCTDKIDKYYEAQKSLDDIIKDLI